METQNNDPIPPSEPNENPQEKTEYDDTNSQTRDSIKEEPKMLGKKTRRNGKKINNDYCSICKKGENLLLCNECIRAYHADCLKIDDKNINPDQWICEICALNQPKYERRTRAKTKAKENKTAATSPKESRAKGKKTNKANAISPKQKNEKEKEKDKSVNGKKEKKKPGRKKKVTNEKNEEKSKSNENEKQNVKPNVKQNVKPNVKPKEKSKEKQKEKPKEKLKENINEKQNEIPNEKENEIPNENPNENQNENENENPNEMENDIQNEKQPNENDDKVGNDDKMNDENKDMMNEEEEDYEYYYANSASKTEILKFLKILYQKKIKNLEDIDFTEEISKILRNSNSVRAINNMLNNTKELIKYKEYWDLVLAKKSEMNSVNKKAVHYPISCKELYSSPERHGLEEKYLNKTSGIVYNYFNGKTFTRMVNVYDFLSTFGSKMYLEKFSLEEFYGALFFSEMYKESEISLLSSIYISLSYLLMTELAEIPLAELYSEGEIELLMIKTILETKREDIKSEYTFIKYTWPELIRLFLISKSFNKGYMSKDVSFIPILDKIYNSKDVISFNNSLNLDEKLYVLEKLVIICYETNIVRYSIKESQEERNQYRKRERELDDDLKEVDWKKSEYERHTKLTQPQVRIQEIDAKLKEIEETKAENKSKTGGDKMKTKLESEKKELEKLMKEINDNNANREEILNQIEELKAEIFDLPTVGRTYMGVDGRGYKYYHFLWMPHILFIRIKNDKSKRKETKQKYEWRIINKKEVLDKDLIDKLSDKGIEEIELKDNLIQISKIMSNDNKNNSKKEKKVIADEEEEKEKENKNSKDKEEENDIVPIGDIFKNQVLNYENIKCPLIGKDKKNKSIIITSKTNQYEPLAEKMKKVEQNISKYLSLDNRQWESPSNRGKIKSWIPSIRSVKNYVNILLFFNERIKVPYKAELLTLADSLFGKSATRKIIEDEKSDDEDENDLSNKNCPLIVDGNFNPNYINRNLQYANRIKLWTKEFETYNFEKIYLEYLRNVKSIPQVFICLNLFEIIIIELNRRREFYKKKGDNLLMEAIKNDENRINNENLAKNAMESFNKMDFKKPKGKKKKLIDWNVKCMVCHEYGELLCCESCPNVAHLTCAKLTKLPNIWRCSLCARKPKK